MAVISEPVVSSSGLVDSRSANRAKLKYSPPPEAPRYTIIEHCADYRHNEELNRPVDNNNKKCLPVKMFRGGLKLKERFIVGASVAAVLFTFFIVLDIQMDLGMSGHHLVPSHGRVKYVNEDGPGSAYNSFRKRFLQKTVR